jgi:Leucine-rich repeat (LRR) protein
MSALPAQLAPFSSLTLLNLQHNQLQLCAVAPLAALPALHHLDLSYNPLQGPAHCTYTAQAASCTEGSATGQEHRGFAQLQVLDLSSSRVKQLQPLQELLGCMQALTVLRLLNTPLAERCRAGRVPEQVCKNHCDSCSGMQLCLHSACQHTAGLTLLSASEAIRTL